MDLHRRRGNRRPRRDCPDRQRPPADRGSWACDLIRWGFFVNAPKGWVLGSTARFGSGTPVLALARIKQSNGVESHLIVEDSGQSVPLASMEAAWTPFVESGKFPNIGMLGALKRTTIAGAPALIVDFQGSKYSGQLLILDYGSKTYLIELSSDPTEFNQLRDTDFAAILSS